MEEIDAGGEWWLPERPERRVAGWLKFTVDAGITLRLVGAFRDIFEEGERRPDGSVAMTVGALDHAGAYPKIHGQMGSKSVTLERCFRMRLDRTFFRGDLATEEIHADHMYRGVWYDPNEEPCGDRITVTLSHLVYWMRPSALDEAWAVDWKEGWPADVPVIEVKARDVPTIDIDRPEGKLSLLQHLGLSGDRISGRTITQDVVARFESPKVMPWQALLNEVGALQDILTLVTSRVASVETMTMAHPDVAERLPDDDRVIRRDIEVFARWSGAEARLEPKVLHEHEVLFHFDVVGVDGLRRLLDVAHTYRIELRRIAATIGSPGMYTSDRLLNRCAAVESFDRIRRQTTQSKFTTRMRECVRLAGEPFHQIVSDNIDGWLAALEQRRNQAAHQLDSGDDPESSFVDLVLADSTYFLFALCVMREAKLEAGVFELLRENGKARWVEHRLREVLAPER